MNNYDYISATNCFCKTVYENPLASQKDVVGFVLEGSAEINFPEGRMRLSSTLDPSIGQAANYVYWCDEIFPSDVLIEWDFYPLAPSGLCIMFFAARSRSDGGSVFNTPPRVGKYEQYYNGDINAFHVSYFRTNGLRGDIRGKVEPMRLCNLRKSKGFHMAAQGGDPIPELEFCRPPYRVGILKHGRLVAFYVEKILSFFYYDDGIAHGPLLGGGQIGFRQMSPMISEYANLTVRTC